MEVIALPASTIPVKVCDALYDAKGIYVQTTDKPADERWIMEMYAFRHNVQLTDLLNPYVDPITNFKPTEDSGRVSYALYHPTDRWVNPTTGEIELIPDYTRTSWSATGKAVFPSVTVGAAKATRYPNHGQELYDLTGGDLGWNYNTGKPGKSNGAELYGLVESLQQYFIANLGRKVSAFSYRNGQKGGYKMLMKYFLGGRNSDLYQSSFASHGKTNYGKSKDTCNNIGYPQYATTREDRISFECTTRVKDMSSGLNYGTLDETLNYSDAEIAYMLINGGCINDFIHRYQWATPDDRATFNTYLSRVNAAIGNNLVWRTSYERMVEYLFFRTMISSAVAYTKNNRVHIMLRKADPFKNNVNSGIPEKLLYELIRVPISVRIDLTGTILAGKTVRSNIGTLLSKGNNVYVVQIPFGYAFEGFSSVQLYEATASNTISLALPVITAFTKVGTTITVTTDQPTRCVLFRYASSGAEAAALVQGRSNDLKTTHTFSIVGYTGSYKFTTGVITETRQSILSNAI